MGLSNLTFFNTSNIKEVERQLQNKNNEKEETSKPEATGENFEASKPDPKDQENAEGLENVGKYNNDGLQKSTEISEQVKQGSMEKYALSSGPQGEKSVVATQDSEKKSRKRRGNTL